ncbi:MAG: hypothetical protein Fur0043_24690 [Anaerolineales bacterium]
MNHRPFEDWLLDDLVLSPEQKRELNIHLRTCKSCTALAEANLALRAARVAGPAPGFSARWQERLVLARQTQRRQTLIGTLVFSIGGLLLLALLAGPTIASVIGSPAVWISNLVQGALFLYTLLMATGEAGAVLFRVLPDFLPPFAWLVMLSTLGGLGLLWSVSIWRLTRAPQGVQL